MHDPIRVQTPAGPLAGTTTDTGGSVFAGVPFATPPVDALRFRPPQPMPDATDDIDATTFRRAPAQPQGALGMRDPDTPPSATVTAMSRTVLRYLAAQAAQRVQTSEDCLYLNVWVPESLTRAPGRAAGQASPVPAPPSSCGSTAAASRTATPRLRAPTAPHCRA